MSMANSWIKHKQIDIDGKAFQEKNYSIAKLDRVPTHLEKSGKSENFSRSGNCQGILERVREFLKRVLKSGKSQGNFMILKITTGTEIPASAWLGLFFNLI